jgi:hypothetical protein
MKVLPAKNGWQGLRFYLIGMACAGIFDCAVAFLLVRAAGGNPRSWNGFLNVQLPVSQWTVFAIAVVVAPLLMAGFKVLSETVGGPRPGAAETEGGDAEAAFRRWRRGQMLFYSLSSLLPTVAFFYVLLFGMLPALLVVAAQYTVGALLCLPRKADAPKATAK